MNSQSIGNCIIRSTLDHEEVVKALELIDQIEKKEKEEHHESKDEIR